MSDLTRRHFLRAVTAAPVLSLVPWGRADAQTPTALRMLLNSGYSSVNAWFCLAEDRGYLKEAGLRLTFTDGIGAYTAAGRTAAEGFDLGYGDVNALVEQAAASNPKAPLAVYMMFNRSPSVVAVPAGSPIRTPKATLGEMLVSSRRPRPRPRARTVSIGLAATQRILTFNGFTSGTSTKNGRLCKTRWCESVRCAFSR